MDQWMKKHLKVLSCLPQLINRLISAGNERFHDRVWPNKIKSLTAHLSQLRRLEERGVLGAERAVARYCPVVESAELVAGSRGVLSLQHYYNISCMVQYGPVASSWNSSFICKVHHMYVRYYLLILRS